jgi:hypothetical protein
VGVVAVTIRLATTRRLSLARTVVAERELQAPSMVDLIVVSDETLPFIETEERLARFSRR